MVTRTASCKECEERSTVVPRWCLNGRAVQHCTCQRYLSRLPR